MKHIKILLILSILFPALLYSQGDDPELHNFEVTVYNNTSDTLEVMLHPVSAIFNGNNYYTLVAKTTVISSNLNSYNYINGIHYKQPDIIERKNILEPKFGTTIPFKGWNVDNVESGNDYALGAFSYGMYKLIIKNLRTERVDSCLMEFDYGGLQQSDLFFYLYDDTITTNYRFSYKFF